MSSLLLALPVASRPVCITYLCSSPTFYFSFGSGEEDGEESFDDSDARRKLEEYQGSTAAAAAANRDQGNNRDGPSDSDENGAPQDEQQQAVEAAAEAAAAAGVTPYLQKWTGKLYSLTLVSRHSSKLICSKNLLGRE